MSADNPRQSLQRQTDAFLREFFEKGEMLVKELITENDRLRSQLETKPEPDVKKGSKVTRDNMVELLMMRISALEHECDEIRKIAGNVEEESGGFRSRLDSLESEHYHLASMFVAGSQFHSATTIEEVMRTITEILLNFVGAGAFVVYMVDEERQVLFPVVREGGSVEEIAEIPLVGDEAGPAQAAMVALGRPWRNGDPLFQIGGELINLPLVSGSRLVGLARLESFLEQKHGFADNDHQLLGLISEHAGIGIENAWVRAHAKEVPLQRQAIEHLVGA
ncbi:MAG: GAF domain-containing protein [Myxococcales bacterium]|nr:GAF domain-containing protein [Myxococcales bacterium]